MGGGNDDIVQELHMRVRETCFICTKRENGVGGLNYRGGGLYIKNTKSVENKKQGIIKTRGDAPSPFFPEGEGV